jgi:hypothetical protein
MRGYRLLDEVGARVGRIHEVYGDWLLVCVGRFAEVHTLVPAEEAVVAGRHVWVPYRLDHMLSAAPLAQAGEPTERIAHELRIHYGLAPVLARG